MKKKRLAVPAALLLAVCLLLLCQELLTPKYMESLHEGALIAEYYPRAGQNDVVFIGDCEVYESFSPVTLWEEYGIPSYIRGSAQQLIWQSYYLMEETLRHETPRAVVFNVLSVKYDEPQNEAYNRMTLDGMKLSPSKLASIRASMTEEEDMITYLVPLLRYHARWSELGGEDFRYLFHRREISHNGYLMQVGQVPMESQKEGKPLGDYTISDVCWEYLDKMTALARENGVELILIKAPTNSWNYYWYDEWDAQIEAYAARNGLAYYNFIDDTEAIGLDFATDTYDGGIHLNVFGVEKMSSYFGRLLVEKHGLSDRRDEAALSREWDGICRRYHEERAERVAAQTKS